MEPERKLNPKWLLPPFLTMSAHYVAYGRTRVLGSALRVRIFMFGIEPACSPCVQHERGSEGGISTFRNDWDVEFILLPVAGLSVVFMLAFDRSLSFPTCLIASENTAGFLFNPDKAVRAGSPLREQSLAIWMRSALLVRSTAHCSQEETHRWSPVTVANLTELQWEWSSL